VCGRGWSVGLGAQVRGRTLRLAPHALAVASREAVGAAACADGEVSLLCSAPVLCYPVLCCCACCCALRAVGGRRASVPHHARACRRALADQFHLHTTLLTWVGVGMVLVITWTYMSIALKLPKE
jgi:hypothetical protein